MQNELSFFLCGDLKIGENELRILPKNDLLAIHNPLALKTNLILSGTGLL